MAVTTKIVRVANPERGRGKFRLRTARRKSAGAKRRRMSPKQIRHFGTKAQKAALKRKHRARFTKSVSTGATGGRKRKRTKNSHRSASRVKVVYRYRTANPKRRTRRRRSNPALVVTLGSINPKRRKSVAKSRKRRTRRASNTRRRSTTRRRRNTRRTRVVVVSAPRRRRRHNGSSIHRRRIRRHHRRSVNRRSRNPFMGGGASMLKAGAGILLGVTAAKLIPKAVPASVASSVGSGSIMAIGISGAAAWVTGWVLGKFVDKTLGEYAMYGGIAQTISVALNAFLPSVGGTFSLGDLVNGNFVVPQNPIRSGMGGGAMSAPAARGMAAYGSAY